MRNQPLAPARAQRTAAARRLWQEHGAALVAEGEIARLLAEYHQAILRSQGLMRSDQAFAACADCAGEGGGASCCFAGAEEWYGELLLLINLMLGAELPDEAEGGQDCFFNGAEGCRLTAHFAICLNFFCPALSERLGPERLARLRRVIGRELNAGQALEEVMLRWFRERGVAVSL
ncbi:MAG: hypothetical protein K9K66_08475 [Desulfarculaceae bacterium]|nr:hypothetical protein [Desulfarculaceae bacterium]MCF8071355.1 hypothetical protein [Desulfarculaceae bacterium]MCF8101680.1 hypothetical protein [Desulfarculaceae bacterium]MCF8116711.1 hypothetical protein [Desulfarculaceae bacterium]